MNVEKFLKPFRVTNGKNFRLKDCPTDAAEESGIDKKKASELLQEHITEISELQGKLYAQEQWAFLMILQAMDAAGKDGAIKHVMTGINPQGVEVSSFKTPSSLEQRHDFLWRTTLRLPERGKIGIFNRSYYEEVLAVRVEEGYLDAEKLPKELRKPKIWRERMKDIGQFEGYLGRNGTLVRKIFLHISPEEQHRRFLARLDDPLKNWKFSPSDLKARQSWDNYMAAYEEAIGATASDEAPWYIVPADKKWFARLVVGAITIEGLSSLDLEFPAITGEQRQRLEEARKLLEAE